MTGRRPPITVWCAAGLLAGPPLVFYVLLVRQITGLDARGLLVVGWLWVLAGVGLAGRLLLGRGGIVGGFALLAALGLLAGLIALGVAQSGTYRDIWPLVVPAAYLFATGYLLWWPDTRRWCGQLPQSPADTDDD